ncbi:MAG TPA: hypothetical protein VGG28_28735 [Kofleriaceae bacterium]|jgi:hypothetical protein
MKDTTTNAPQKSIAASGIVPGVTHLALDVVDRSQSLVIALLHDARGEIRAVADGAIELAEKTAAASFRFTKKLVQRVDDGISETLTSAEKILGGAVKSARDTAKAATDLAHTAQAGLAGERASA